MFWARTWRLRRRSCSSRPDSSPAISSCPAWRKRRRLPRRLAAGDRGRGRRAVHALARAMPAIGRALVAARGFASRHLVRGLARVLRRGPGRSPRPRGERSGGGAPATARSTASTTSGSTPCASPDGGWTGARRAGALADRCGEWRRPVTPGRGRAVPALLRLEEPPPSEARRQRRRRALDGPLPAPGRRRPEPARPGRGRLERRRRGAASCGASGFDAEEYLLALARPGRAPRPRIEASLKPARARRLRRRTRPGATIS